MHTNPAVSRLMWFFAIVYAVEGMGQAKTGILGQPITYYLKQTQGWEPVHISASLAALDIPWVIKPLWGAISDFVPVFGYRRRPYLVLANLLGIGAFASVAMLPGVAGLIPALTLSALAMAISSTLCGALLVETGHRHNASASFVNQQWLFYNIAQMLTVLTAGYLIEVLSPHGALQVAASIAAVAPVAIIGSVWLVEEDRASIDLPALRSRLRALMTVFRSKNLWFVAGFLFLYFFSPGFGTPLYFEMSDQLGFSQGFIGILSSVAAGGWIVGGLLYRWKLRHLSRLSLLRLSITGGVLSALSYLALSGPASAVVIWFLGGIAAMIAIIATVSLAADACPEGAEGFAFAGMMSVVNIAGPLSDNTGSFLYQHVFDKQLTPLIWLSAGATALVFLLIPLVTNRVRAPTTGAVG